jgi:glyoxylase-like metal-dependent hydrolase (beta-lactamase superfamily II)
MHRTGRGRAPQALAWIRSLAAVVSLDAMTAPLELSRRVFLADLGRGSVAVALFGVAACGPAATGTPSSSAAASVPAVTPSTPVGSPANGFDWARVDLGFVSAYILVRGGEAAIVDTGVAGSAGQIEASLTGLGLGWDAVGHVIVTHLHGDHAGSAAAVLDAAPDATGYAGEADIGGITVPRPLTAVADGDTVFDLRIITTPGHTPGHIAVLDEIGGILVAGDALGTTGGTLAGSNPQFTADPAAAEASVAKLGALPFETLLVGHGDPIVSGASAQVAALAASS